MTDHQGTESNAAEIANPNRREFFNTVEAADSPVLAASAMNLIPTKGCEAGIPDINRKWKASANPDRIFPKFRSGCISDRRPTKQRKLSGNS